MAKPLSVNIPPFCLACFGTDNKFTTEHIMLRCIVQECQKRGLKVLSFGGTPSSVVKNHRQINSVAHVVAFFY